MTDWFNRLALAAAGILGATGVAAAAAASHGGDQCILGALALVALTHAPATLALALHGGNGLVIRFATALIALGALVFCGDLTAIHFLGASPLPVLAPLGGAAMIAGWLALIPAAFVVRR